MLKNRFFKIFLRMALLTLAVCTILRIILLFNEQTLELGFGALQWISVFILGALNDIFVFSIGYIFMWLFLVTLSNKKYNRPWGYIILGILVAAFVYVTFFNTIFDEYGSVAPLVASIVLGFWAGSYGLRLFLEKIRRSWSEASLAILLALYMIVIILNAVSEYYFWNEFGVRYNFIAVDYLVYTNEVIGNIVESYPLFPILGAILIVTSGIIWWLFRKDIGAVEEFKNTKWKLKSSLVYAAMAIVSVFLLPLTAKLQTSDNVYYNELQANGVYKFYEAFKNNELDFTKFYRTVPEEEAEAFIHSEYGSTEKNYRHIESPNEERHCNIILVTLESMSAEYMARYGNSENLTPYMDSLCNKSLVFDRLFATGNRTVRGLEAVTLSLPPCPGQSIIKQPDNGNLHSTGAILREKGYDVFYFYGGDSYFDNMETFFSGNNYEIVDKKSYTSDEITFSNIWGVCDEDSYNKVIKTLEAGYRNDRPFFAHIMSISNHRPYTYPAGRIPIPNDSKSRAGGVMYSDYALGKFIENASRQPWFSNTVFVITADHCASSAGKTELPLEKYHIPAIIYAPEIVKADIINKTASQIDLMPTLFSLLGFDYDSWFYGNDILAENFRQRAFIATYQSLGYLENDCLTILSPVNRTEQFLVRPNDENPYHLERASNIDSTLLFSTIAYYQTSSQWSKHR